MRINFIYFTILASSFAISCSRDPISECCTEPKNHVVKFKEGNEYLADHVYVLLNKERDRIIGYPDKAIVSKSALDYYRGYILNKPDFGVNTGYLTLTLEEFALCCDTLRTITMDHLIIEDDPYAEYYYDVNDYLITNCSECNEADTTWLALDTVKFHHLVDNAELDKYLIRLK